VIGECYPTVPLSFGHQIVVTLLDKGLLALILAIAGYWLNRHIEAFKSRRALENELKKVRDQKLIELLQSQLSQFYWPVYLRFQMDNAIWEKILQRDSTDSVKARVGDRIESDFILPNHEATCKLIEANIHLATPDDRLLQAILSYLRHVAVYRALRASGIKDVDPLDVGEPWPSDVFPVIEAATLAKQRDFEAVLKQHTE
jgi:hypothetical protein